MNAICEVQHEVQHIRSSVERYGTRCSRYVASVPLIGINIVREHACEGLLKLRTLAAHVCYTRLTSPVS